MVMGNIRLSDTAAFQIYLKENPLEGYHILPQSPPSIPWASKD